MRMRAAFREPRCAPTSLPSRPPIEQAAKQALAEGKTVDELAEEAIKRLLAQKSLNRFKHETASRRGNKSDEEVEAIVDNAIRESRNENRSR